MFVNYMKVTQALLLRAVAQMQLATAGPGPLLPANARHDNSRKCMPAAIANRARAESTSTNDRWTAASADVVTDLSWSKSGGWGLSRKPRQGSEI